MVRLLIESGADVNAQLQVGQYGSALAASTGCGSQALSNTNNDRSASCQCF
jgi:hypothetical protein